MAANIFASWRSGLVNGMNTRHQPLWNLISPTPFRDINYGWIGPIARLSLWLVGLSMLCWMVLWLKISPNPTILQFVAGYETNLLLPANVAGVRCARNMVDLKNYLKASTLQIGNAKTITAADLRQNDKGQTNLSNAIEDKKNEKVLILNFFMSGSVNAKGPYLLPNDADKENNDENRLYVRDILKILKNKMNHDQIKVIIFDAEQEEPLWRFGMLENLFAESLMQMEEEINAVPNLVVVNSCSPGEFSWRNHNVGLSNFGFNLVRAFSGEATDQDSDGQLTLAEMFKTVQKEVSDWTKTILNLRQEVLILPIQEKKGQKLLAKINITQAGRTSFSPPPIKQLGDDPELRSLWEKHEALNTGKKSPATLCPDVWDRYQRTILRYEELRRMAENDQAKNIKEEILILEKRIEKETLLGLESTTTNLWMANIAGTDLTEKPDETTSLTDLIRAPITEMEPRLKAILEANQSGIGSGAEMRMKLIRQVLKSGITTPQPDWEKIKRLIVLLESPDKLRPLESQALQIFLRDKPATERSNTNLQVYLQTLMLAERTACGLDRSGSPVQASERGAMFLRNKIHALDSKRQLAQDKLFSTDESVRALAASELVQIQTEYTACGQQATIISQALNNHDQMMSNMPFYTTWVTRFGRKWASKDTDDKNSLLYEKLAGDIWKSLHTANAKKISAVNSLMDGKDPFQLIQEVISETNTALALYEKLKNYHLDSCRTLTNSNTYGENEFMDNVLQVPCLDTALRMQIIRTTFTPENITGKEINIDLASNKNEYDRWQMNYSKRKAILSLQLIGKDLFDENDFSPYKQPEEFEKIKRSYDNCMALLKPNSSNHFSDMVEVGSQVGMRLSFYQNACDTMLDLANTLEENGGKGKLGLVCKADSLDRIANIDSKGIPEAGSIIRRAWINHFMVYQAKRSWEEHLFNLNTSLAFPYYQKAMDAMIGDASGSSIIPSGLSEVKALRNLNGEIKLSLVGLNISGVRTRFKSEKESVSENQIEKAPTLNWTTEKNQTIEFEVYPNTGGSVPQGVVQLEVNQDRELIQTIPKGGIRRSLNMNLHQDKITLTNPDLIKVEFSAPIVEAGQDATKVVEPQRRKSRVVATALFRGQRIDLEVPFDLHPTAPIIRSKPIFQGKGTLAIRANKEAIAKTGLAKGNIAIIVDCSGSMGPKGDSKGKIALVAEALEKVVSKLPPGINFSVWVFGQAEGPARTLEKPEDAIRLVAGPSILGQDTEEVAKSISSRFQNGELVPWNKSPVIAAMAKAAKVLTGSIAQAGPSTMLVLTDGKDNRALEDKGLNPQKLSIPALLGKTFAGSNIKINVIAFQAGEEENQAKEDFEGLPKMEPPGSFISANDLDTLINQMERSLRREFLYQVEDNQNFFLTGMPADGFAASQVGFSDKWILPGIEPGEYLIRSGRMRPPLGIARLQAGDALLLKLDEDGKPGRTGILEDNPNRPQAQLGDWKSGLIYNRRDKSSIKRLAVLEKTWNPTEVDLLQVRPGICWWECEPLESGLYSNRITDEPGFASPAWSINSPWWPTKGDGSPSAASLSVWWLPSTGPIPFMILRQGEKSKVDFIVATELSGKSMIFDEEIWLLESVTLESRSVHLGSDRYEIKPTLVIRSRTTPPPPGKSPKSYPIANLEGVQGIGREDIIHPQAGKIASVFWPIDSTTVKNISSIQFSSLARLKKEAEESGRFIRLKSTGEPDGNDQAPQKSIESPFAPINKQDKGKTTP